MASITKDFIVMKANKSEVLARAATLAEADTAAQQIAADDTQGKVVIYELVAGYNTPKPTPKALTIDPPGTAPTP